MYMSLEENIWPVCLDKRLVMAQLLHVTVINLGQPVVLKLATNDLCWLVVSLSFHKNRFEHSSCVCMYVCVL